MIQSINTKTFGITENKKNGIDNQPIVDVGIFLQTLAHSLANNDSTTGQFVSKDESKASGEITQVESKFEKDLVEQFMHFFSEFGLDKEGFTTNYQLNSDSQIILTELVSQFNTKAIEQDDLISQLVQMINGSPELFRVFSEKVMNSDDYPLLKEMFVESNQLNLLHLHLPVLQKDELDYFVNSTTTTRFQKVDEQSTDAIQRNNILFTREGASEEKNKISTEKISVSNESQILSISEVNALVSLVSADNMKSLNGNMSEKISVDNIQELPQKLASNLVEKVQEAKNPSMQQVTIELSPENLGKLEISIKITESKVQLEIHTDSQQTLKLMENFTNKFEQVLEKQQFLNQNIHNKTNTQVQLEHVQSPFQSLNHQFSQQGFQQNYTQQSQKFKNTFKAQEKVEKLEEEIKDKQINSTISILA